MSTVAQLITQIEKIIKTTADSGDVIEIFNECLREDLVNVLRLETVSSTNLTDIAPSATWPADLFELQMVKCDTAKFLERLDFDNESDKGYTVYGKEITPKNITLPDTLRIYYYRYPAIITATTETPDIPSQFHHALKYFYAARYFRDAEDIDLEGTYMNTYLGIKNEIDKHTKKQRGRGQSSKVKNVLWFLK